MSSNIPASQSKVTTLESIIEGLDERGLLVLQVLIGQQSIKLLSKKHESAVTKPNVLRP